MQKSRRVRSYLCTSKSGGQMNGCTSQSPAYKVEIKADCITQGAHSSAPVLVQDQVEAEWPKLTHT